jgi:NitT/TauT family transport system substrate-binding protein
VRFQERDQVGLKAKGKGWLGLCLAAMAVACGGGASHAPASVAGVEQPHLKVGIISVTATYVPLYLAVDDGLFAEEGLQVDLLPFRGGSDLIKAVVAGSADVGVVSLAEVTSAIAAGQAMKAFYGGFNVPAFDWYAVPSIHCSPRRKANGSASRNTDRPPATALRCVEGPGPAKDVQIVEGGDSPTRLAAMQAGQIDVNIFAPPDTFVAAERGYGGSCGRKIWHPTIRITSRRDGTVHRQPPEYDQGAAPRLRAGPPCGQTEQAARD